MKPRTRCLGLLVGLLSIAPPAHAQLAVFDAANFGEDLVQTAQLIITVANQVLELTGIDGLVVDDAFQADLTQMQDIVTNARGLSYDLQSLNAQIATLFDLSTAPNGTRALRERLQAIRQVVYECHVDALRVQTLLYTTLNTIRHLTGLVASIEGFLGNMQANQNLVQYQATIAQKITMLQTQSAAFERARTVERMARLLAEQSAIEIDKAIMEDYPK